MNKTLKWIFISLGMGLLIFVVYWVCSIIIFFGMFEQTFNKKDLIENYQTKKEEIQEVKRYIKSVIPKDKIVSIEFENNSELFFFHLSDKNGSSNNWNVSITSKKADSLLTKLGWKKEMLLLLKEKLDKANCISLENGEPFTIGYQRSGMGIYFYELFDKPMTDSLKIEYSDGCTYQIYNDNVALKFSGGAIGQQCFKDFKNR